MARVPSARGVAALGLEVVEEREDHRRVEILERQRRGRPSGSLLDVAEQQLEGVAVARDRVRAGATFCDETALKEVLQKRWESDLGRHHDGRSCSCRANRSKRSELMAISSGTAERYQYVAVTLAWPR